jgi:hypothetical protein
VRVVQLGDKKKGAVAPSVEKAQQPASARAIRDRFLDQWVTAGGARLNGLVAAVLAKVDHQELISGLRQRRRRGEDLETHRRLVENIVANLAYTVIDKSKRPKTIAVSLSKALKLTRYDHHIFGQLPALLPLLKACGLVKVVKSRSLGRRTTIEASARFTRKVQASGITLEDFGTSELQELIVVSRGEKGFSAAGNFGTKREWIDYADTAATRRYRKEMKRINAHLAAANLEFDASGLPPSAITDTSIHRRRLRRYFNHPPWLEGEAPSFTLGGRLFGSWWLNLDKKLRGRIRIDGEDVADLDFSSMFPRLAYMKLGLEPPPGDLYDGIPGLEDPKYREGVKGMMNTLLFAKGAKLRMPSEFKKELPQGWTAAKVRAAILVKHPSLEAAFERSLGFELFFDESRVAIATLLRLIDEEITALPIHDGLLAPVSKKERVRTVMEETAKQLTGHALPTSEKSSGV